MRDAGLVGASHRRGGPVTTRRDREARPAPDLVDRDFAASGPNALWVADITFVPTATGFTHLAVVLDAWSRRVVGWSMTNHLRTELVLDALEMAVGQRKPDDVVHHSDQGSQGGLNRSSQRPDDGGCDDDEGTALGPEATGPAALARAAAGGAAGGPGPVLGGDRGGAHERGRGTRGGPISSRRGQVVPEVRWNAAIASVRLGQAAVGAPPLVRGTRGDRAAPGPRPRRARHCAVRRPRPIDDLARAAAQRGDPSRRPRVPRHDRAVARRSLRASAPGVEARAERGAALLRGGPPGGPDRAGGRR